MLALVAALALVLVPGAVSAVGATSNQSAAAGSLSEADALAAALDYLEHNLGDLGLAAGDVADVVATSTVRDAHNGVAHVYLQQRHRGIEVMGAHMTVNVARDGTILSAPSRFVSGLAEAAAGDAVLGAGAAVESVADDAGLGEPRGLEVLDREGGPAREVVLTDGGVAEGAISARLVWQPRESGKLRLAWLVELSELSGEHLWQTTVDAETGAVLERTDLVVQDDVRATAAAVASSDAAGSSGFAAFAEALEIPVVEPAVRALDGSSYRVYRVPLESPSDGDRTLEENPADADASPFGWHDTDGIPGPEFTVTRGNNVHAYTDFVAPANVPDPGSDPDGGPGLDFDFPIDLTQHPNTYSDAAVTNLFYWNNVIHDVFYGYGFDEASGNFQVSNYGNGGLGNDDVRAEAQDGGGLNNANFLTLVDGSRPRMQMFLWTFGLQNRVVVDPPSPAAGTYRASGAVFGPATTAAGVSGSIALVNDGVGATSDGCEPFVGFPAGSIAILDRGTCTFVLKVSNAQAAGATAVIVANNVAGNPVTMGGADPTIAIPSVMVSQADGATIKGGLPATGNVSRDPVLSVMRDGDLDAGIITHEYGHGISNRLTGGPNVVGCLGNQEQMGEGWSDWLALAITALPTDSGPGSRGIGTYALYEQDRTGTGIRPTAYSTDMTIDPATYDSVKTLAVPHGVGYVWATMLWELYWNLVDEHGFNPNTYEDWTTGGNNLAIQLVMDGMKFQPCSPGFVDGRDAILAADAALTGGANECEIWRAFTKRGLGFGAVQGSSASRADGTQSFDLPVQCFFTGGKLATSRDITAQAGSAIPLVFSLVGDKGLDVFAPGSPSSREVDCATGAPLGPSSPIETPGSSGLSYDAATDSYTYVWKTLKAWNGTCRELTISLAAGYSYTAIVRF